MADRSGGVVTNCIRARQMEKWIHAIRRDVGIHFQLKKWTKVCSRHFREYDFIKTLSGRRELRKNAVPSLFSWTRTSPRKRKAPTVRKQFVKTRHVLLSETQTNEEPVERENASESEEDETNEIEGSTKQDVVTQTNEIRSNDSADSDKEMISQLIDLKTELQRANRRIESLQQQMFTVDRFGDDDSSIKFYTGLPNWDTFNAVFKYLNPGNEGQNISYWVSKINVNVSAAVYEGENEEAIRKKGRPRYLRPIDEFFAVICRLRQGFTEEHLAHLFQVSVSTVSRIFITWINFIYLRLGQINIWPTREVVSETMPEDFKHKYSSTRVIIDCTEEKDSIMADKGFTIQDLLPLGVSLNIPPFLGSSAQMPAQDVVHTQEIASLRIHVERAINKIKNFHIWDGVVPLHQFGVVNQMWAICAILCNAQSNIISI
ncbi:hypothetical protein P5673_030629 [Acropora cervicornis]|uniref:THAP-type domain-containing protein n=1 Tax=Acropora cervicornis TaxID=6130 RepID=A0AAD9UTD8_ACRCE|nr:hypothetical protein P5673_030629 [Acropora cervicornis]